MPVFSGEELESFRAAIQPVCRSLSTSLSESVGIKVTCADPVCVIKDAATLEPTHGEGVQASFIVSGSGSGATVLFIAKADAATLAALLGDPTTEAGDRALEAALHKLAEAFTGSIGEALGSTGGPVDFETSTGPLALPAAIQADVSLLQVELPLALDNGSAAAITLILSSDLARTMIPLSQAESPLGMPADPNQHDVFLNEFADESAIGLSQNFHSFQPLRPTNDGLPNGIGLLLDIPLEVTVELGRVRMLIKDVLDLSAGSIVELERVAGEPVDLMVNGRLVAKGEVVVIEDNFGIRITEIINPGDRISAAAA